MSNEHEEKVLSIYVYEAPLRLWHWINALAITVLAVTGYLIGSPPEAMIGEASEHYRMGIIRFLHFGAGYVLLFGFIGRIYWAFAGNEHARELFVPKMYSILWWKELLTELKWYLFLTKEPHKYVGHNPLAQFAMFFIFLVGMVFMICTGFALYSEGAGAGTWSAVAFGWVRDIFPNSQTLHTWHHLGMWYLLTFVMAHVYVAIREDIMSRQSIVSTMISGHRLFKDDRP